MNEKDYLLDPCGASSLPFWKTKRLALPPSVTVLRDDVFSPEPGADDTPYFKLIHRLKDLERPSLPTGFSLVSADVESFAAHIAACYEREGVSVEELEDYRRRSVFRADLWIALREDAAGSIVATGIAELDPDIREGVLEWIQVSPAFRRRGLGSFLVRELLFRLRTGADFVTVSGRLDNPDNPLALYRSCGFEGPVIWHILCRSSPPEAIG